MSPQNGEPQTTGSLDVLWQDARHYRTELVLPAESPLVEVDDGNKAWRTGTWTVTASASLAQMGGLSPFLPLHEQQDSYPADSRLSDQTNLDCFATAPDLPRQDPQSAMARTSYCLGKGNHLLRLIDRPGGWRIVFNDLQPFGNKYVGHSIEVLQNGVTLARLHVESLTAADAFDALSQPPPDGAQVLPFHRVDVPYRSGEPMYGRLIERVEPVYPPGDASDGLVTLKVHIATSGKVVGADVLDAPTQLLANAAVTAVQKWRYEAAYQDNELIPIDTIVKVKFQRR